MGTESVGRRGVPSWAILLVAVLALVMATAALTAFLVRPTMPWSGSMMSGAPGARRTAGSRGSVTGLSGSRRDGRGSVGQSSRVDSRVRDRLGRVVEDMALGREVGEHAKTLEEPDVLGPHAR